MCMRKCANEYMVHHVHTAHTLARKMHQAQINWTSNVTAEYICLSVRIRGVCVHSLPIDSNHFQTTMHNLRNACIQVDSSTLCTSGTHAHMPLGARARVFIHISIDVEYTAYARTQHFCYGKLTCANKCACLNARRFLMLELCWIAAIVGVEVKPMHFGSKVSQNNTNNSAAYLICNSTLEKCMVIRNRYSISINQMRNGE